MAKSLEQKFSDFKVRNNLDNEIITKMISEYANSSLELARTHFTEKYNISQRTFYKARDFCVIFCLVDNDICKKLRKKSSTNYSKNNDKNSCIAPIAHFDDLLIQRQKFLDRFSINEIQDIGNKYIEGCSVEIIAKAYGTGVYAVNYLLKKGISMLIFDSSVVNQLSDIAKGSLENILQKRKKNKQLLIKCYQSELVFLNLQIENYDLYFRNGFSNQPSIEDLKRKVANVTKMYNEALKL